LKQIVKNVVAFLNLLFLGLKVKNFLFKNNTFFRVRILGVFDNSSFKLSNSVIEKSVFTVLGKSNKIVCNKALISSSKINIKGANNNLIIEEGVKLRDSIIHLRGNNCTIEIKKKTTFGGVRIVNVGENNNITIGENCLFSDQIEIWASDTHSIFDSNNKLLNPEKPIIIENNVWVGCRVIILKGVIIKKGSVVGMGSVVTNNIDSNTINVGYPTRMVKSNINWKLEY